MKGNSWAGPVPLSCKIRNTAFFSKNNKQINHLGHLMLIYNWESKVQMGRRRYPKRGREQFNHPFFTNSDTKSVNYSLTKKKGV
jgi:hypothetical protein